MTVNPIPVLIIILLSWTFQAILFGGTLAEQSFPTFEQPESGGFWGALDTIVAIVQGVWGAIVFFFNLLTFNVPGAPWWIRLIVGGAHGGALIWAIAGMIRGGS